MRGRGEEEVGSLALTKCMNYPSPPPECFIFFSILMLGIRECAAAYELLTMFAGFRDFTAWDDLGVDCPDSTWHISGKNGYTAEINNQYLEELEQGEWLNDEVSDAFCV